MSVFGDIGNFLWGGNDGANQAGSYYQQIPDILKQYLKPYADRGNAVYPQLQGQYDQLLNNPGDLLNKLGQGYHESPGYQFQLNQALNAGNRAAAAKGMLGSPMQQQQTQQTASQFANQDFNNYLSHALGLYGQGLTGKQNIYNMGFGASNNLGENLSNALMSQGNLAYSTAANQNQSNQQLLGMLLGLAGGFL
ncbi:MAG TPA: hypothetical protein VGH95_05785 [Candidatus Aquirickettsiella sp.]|jgi:hypothetical protein